MAILSDEYFETKDISSDCLLETQAPKYLVGVPHLFLAAFKPNTLVVIASRRPKPLVLKQ